MYIRITDGHDERLRSRPILTAGTASTTKDAEEAGRWHHSSSVFSSENWTSASGAWRVTAVVVCSTNMARPRSRDGGAAAVAMVTAHRESFWQPDDDEDASDGTVLLPLGALIRRCVGVVGGCAGPVVSPRGGVVRAGGFLVRVPPPPAVRWRCGPPPTRHPLPSVLWSD